MYLLKFFLFELKNFSDINRPVSTLFRLVFRSIVSYVLLCNTITGLALFVNRLNLSYQIIDLDSTEKKEFYLLYVQNLSPANTGKKQCRMHPFGESHGKSKLVPSTRDSNSNFAFLPSSIQISLLHRYELVSLE